MDYEDDYAFMHDYTRKFELHQGNKIIFEPRGVNSPYHLLALFLLKTLEVRDRCIRLVRESTRSHFTLQFKVMADWINERCLARPCEG